MKTINNLDLLENDHIFDQAKTTLRSFFKSSMETLDLTASDYFQLLDLFKDASASIKKELPAIIICLFQEYNSGSVCIKIEEESLIKALCLFLDIKKAELVYKGFCLKLESGEYNDFISKDLIENKPFVLNCIAEQKYLYIQKNYVNASELKEHLQKLIFHEKIISDKEAITKIMHEVIHLSPVRLSKKGKPIEFDDLQLKAMELIFEFNFGVISGGPGTGKTSVIVNILRCLKRLGYKNEEIYLAAPTGKASQRMTESILKNLETIHEPNSFDDELKSLDAKTIHRLLKTYNSKFVYNRLNKFPKGVLIIDEVSMVDMKLMNHLVQSIDTENTKLFFIGDKDQLPSVGAGSVLSDVLPQVAVSSDKYPNVVFLEKTFRSKGKILALTQKIKSDELLNDEIWNLPEELAEVLNEKESNHYLIEQDSKGKDTFINLVKAWGEHYFLQLKLDKQNTYFDLVGQFRRFSFNEGDIDILMQRDRYLDQIFKIIEFQRILSLSKRGYHGVDFMNDTLFNLLKPKFEVNSKNIYFTGLPIQILKNDYGSMVFNGETGLILSDSKGIYRAVFKRYSSYIFIPLETLPEYEYGFATTVHKSQGSEFDNLLMIVANDAPNSLLSKEIIYTGLTRAKSKIVLYSSIELLNKALSTQIQRTSGMKIWNDI